MKFSRYPVFVFLIGLLFAACNGQSTPEAGGIPQGGGQEPLPVMQEQVVPYSTEMFAAGLNFPTRLAFAPDGRLFVTEKGGAVRVISTEGVVQPEPVIELPTNQEGEQGLLGIAVDPNFEENHYIWVYHTWSDPDNERPGETWHRLVRFEEYDGKGSNPEVAWEILDASPDSTILNGGEIGFGPDGNIYVSPGSTNNILVVVDREVPHGKIVRLTPTVPAEIVPIEEYGATYYAYGFRNVYGFTFHPVTGVMYATENGPDCDDEINRVTPGGDYGWRIDGLCEDNNMSEDYRNGKFQPPMLYYTPPISPTGITFYTGDVFPEWPNHMFFCAYNHGKMYRVELAENGFDIIGAGIINTGYGRCAADITEGPDGYIYFSDIYAIFRLVRVEE